MYKIYVSFKVKDFEVWKAAFERGAGPREAAGIRTAAVVRKLEEPNQVIVDFETEDVAAAKAHLMDPNVKKGQMDSGFLAPPEIFVGQVA